MFKKFMWKYGQMLPRGDTQGVHRAAVLARTSFHRMQTRLIASGLPQVWRSGALRDGSESNVQTAQTSAPPLLSALQPVTAAQDGGGKSGLLRPEWTLTETKVPRSPEQHSRLPLTHFLFTTRVHTTAVTAAESSMLYMARRRRGPWWPGQDRHQQGQSHRQVPPHPG